MGNLIVLGNYVKNLRWQLYVVVELIEPRECPHGPMRIGGACPPHSHCALTVRSFARFKKAGHAVTDEYLDYLVMSIQSFLSDINWEKNPEGNDDFSDGVWPGENWYWRPYGAGGSCLNTVLNCNPPTEDGLPTETPAENENGAKVPGSLPPGSSRGAPAKVGLAAAVPPQIAVAGSGLESLKLMLGE